MILVTAAHGNQGRLLIPKLVAAGLPVRAVVRTEESATAIRAVGVEDVLVGDLSQPEMIVRAVSGVEKIYDIGPALWPDERAVGFALVDAAQQEGVAHFVMSSVLHAITTDLVQHEIKRDIEEHLLSSGLEFTILQPANYMLAHRLVAPFERGVFELSWSLERRQSLVDLGDVTDVALTVLRDSADHLGATYELAAPGRYTAHELGRIIGEVIGRSIEVQQIDAETFAARVLGGADPLTMVYELKAMRAITSRYSSHDFVGNPNVLTWLLGRQPNSFESFVRTHWAAFAA